MASSALNKEEIKEFYDSEADLDKKVEELAKLVLKSKHMVAYTGAGISTSAGIPDFRGPDGVWTLKAAKKKRTTPTTSKADAKPTLCHMALVHLQNTGRLKYLVSTNCDGLHIKSGINPDKISEVHGNGNVEACSKCGAVYYRQSAVKPLNYKKMKKTRVTGRVCETADCDGELRYTSVAFSQSMPDVCFDKAEANSEECDLALTMGTSMRVSPSCDLPSMGKKKHGKDHSLVIVNLQKTPYDKFCRVRIFAKIDDVISLLFKKMEQLATIKVGDMVTAQEVGASPPGQSEEKMVTLLPGKVAKVNDDGTYDIQFTSSKSRKQCPRSSVEMFAIPPWQGLGYQTPQWVAGFQKNWPFRSAPDVTWFAGGRHENRHMRKFAQVSNVPDLSAAGKLKICVRSVKSTHKDFLQYCREQEDANAQLAKMVRDKADESTTKRQKDLVEEADNMVAESMKNFELFLRKLEDFLTENTQLLEGTKKFNTAQTSFQFFERKLTAAKGNESSTTPTETPTTTTTTTTYTTTTTTTIAAVTTTPKQKVNERNFDNENVNTTTLKTALER